MADDEGAIFKIGNRGTWKGMNWGTKEPGKGSWGQQGNQHQRLRDC